MAEVWKADLFSLSNKSWGMEVRSIEEASHSFSAHELSCTDSEVVIQGNGFYSTDFVFILQRRERG